MAKAQPEVQFAEVIPVCSGHVVVMDRIGGTEANIFNGADMHTAETVL